jgi:mono/diheme cytochrome c family protein
VSAEPPAGSSGQPRRFPLIALGLVVLLIGVGWAVGRSRTHQPVPTLVAPPPTAPAVDGGPELRGELVYGVCCASCHGPDGHGDGAGAAKLSPPPRDFAARPWRFEPTPETIRRITHDGIPGTAMPSFPTMSPTDIEAVAAHVHLLATPPRLPAPQPSGGKP